MYILWRARLNPTLGNVLTLSLENKNLEGRDGSGLADVALGVLDAFRSSQEVHSGSEPGSVDAGSVGRNQEAVAGGDLLQIAYVDPPWVPPTRMSCDYLGSSSLSGWSLTVGRTCTAVSTSTFSLEETGGTCTKAASFAVTRVSMTSVGEGQGESGEKLHIDLTKHNQKTSAHTWLCLVLVVDGKQVTLLVPPLAH